MLAGNSGYHFQLLNSVIEVNELQKRRVMTKLSKHLDSLVGKRVALLGLAFKPDTDDMREASSLVLAARLEGEGAKVVAYDPVAETARRRCCPASRWRAPRWTRSRGPTRRCWSPSGPSSPSSTGARSRSEWRTPCWSTGGTSSIRDASRAAGITYEAIGRPSVVRPFGGELMCRR